MNKLNSLVGFAVIAIAVALAACTLEAAPETMRETVRAARHYTVTFDTLGGSAIASQTVAYKARVARPGNPVRSDGWLFGGWYREVSCINRWNFNNDIVTQDITIYARWANPTEARAVIFDAAGGTPEPESPVIVLIGGHLDEPQQPSIPFHSFEGWFNGGAATAWNFASDTVTDNIILTAKWKIFTYPVTFNTNGGSAVAPRIVDHGSKIEPVPVTTQGGYTFYAWYRDAAFKTKWDMSSDTVTAITNLYARWVPGSIPGLTLAEKLEWLSANAQSDTNYDLYVVEDEALAPQTLSYSGKSNVSVTLKGFDEVRTISLSSNRSMFTVESGVKLVLDDKITLQGRSNNIDSLVTIKSGGALVMNSGSTIIDNVKAGNCQGGGVYVAGNLTMKTGSIITNNSVSGSAITTIFGGGVYVAAMGTFTMEGGIISRNRAITTSKSYPSYGGGVFVDVGGSFIKTGDSIIYGYAFDVDNTDSNLVKTNTSTSLIHGSAVYVVSSPAKRRETTAGPGVDLDSSTSANWE